MGPGELSRYSDSLRAGRSGDRKPVGWRDFSHLSRLAMVPTLPPANGYRVFPGDKEARAWVLPSTPSSAKIKRTVGLYFTPLWKFVACPFPLLLQNTVYSAHYVNKMNKPSMTLHDGITTENRICTIRRTTQ